MKDGSVLCAMKTSYLCISDQSTYNAIDASTYDFANSPICSDPLFDTSFNDVSHLPSGSIIRLYNPDSETTWSCKGIYISEQLELISLGGVITYTYHPVSDPSLGPDNLTNNQGNRCNRFDEFPRIDAADNSAPYKSCLKTLVQDIDGGVLKVTIEFEHVSYIGTVLAI